MNPILDYLNRPARSQHFYNGPMGIAPYDMPYLRAHELYGAFPQRWIAGLPSKEDNLRTLPFTLSDPSGRITTRVGKANMGGLSHSGKEGIRIQTPYALAEMPLEGTDAAKIAQALLERLPNGKEAGRTRLDGRTTVHVGSAKVYEAMTEGEAQRNLDFALANLESYLHWELEGRKLKAKRDAELAAAEKRAAEQKEREAKAAALEKKALAIYNAVQGTTYARFPIFMGTVQKQKWLDVAKQAEEVRKANSVTILTDQINAGTISADTLGRSLYANNLFGRPYGL